MNTSDIVFTIQEENEPRRTVTHQSVKIEGGANWEQSLAQLRNRSRQQNDTPAQHEASITEQINPRSHLSQPANPTPPASSATRHFGDQELDLAYQEYLKQREQQHNASIVGDEDVGVMIQEDWLAAQAALQSEHNRRHLTERQTLVFKTETQKMEPLPPAESIDEAATPVLPDYAIHVYDLPDLPLTRKIKIVSEQELMTAIAERLKPHLSSVISGMVRQALQKKLANLSYDLQMELSAETPQIVQEILEHNLSTILRVCKEKL